MWLKEASEVLDQNSAAFLEFALKSGMRTGEAIESFNMIIELSKENRLGDYYNEVSSTLEHFHYPKTFLRNTKNVFVSVVPKGLIEKISQC